MKLTALQNFFSAPSFDDKKNDRVAKQLNTLLRLVLTCDLIYLCFIPFLSQNLLGRLIIAGGLVPLLLGLLYYLQKGHIHSVSLLFVGVIWIAMTIGISTGGGVRNPAYSSYMAPILLAGLLISWRATVGLAGLSLLAGLAMIYGEQYEILPYVSDYSSMNMWFVDSITILSVIGFLYLAIANIQDALDRAESSEKKYRTLVEHAADGIFLSNSQGKYLEVNTRGAQMLQYSPQELLNLSISDVVSTQSIRTTPLELNKLQSDKALLVERELKLKNNGLLPVEISAKILPDGNILGIVRDITERKNAENALRESEAQLRLVVTSTPTIFFALDTDGTITLLEGKILNQIGIDPKNLVGKSIFDEFSDIIPNLTEQFERAKQGHGNSSISSFQGITFDTRYAPITDMKGNVIGVAGVATDITERERLREEHLINERLKGDLEKEKELNEFKNQFVSMVSHDFRTPITVIQTSAHILQTYKDRLKPEQTNKHIEKISAQVFRLESMLDTMQLVLKGQAGQLQFNPVSTDLNLFGKNIIDEMKIIKEDNQSLELSTEGDIRQIPVDINLLHHILSNLITNAIKYSPNGGKIELIIKRHDENILIHVRDQGIGIPLSDQEQLFTPYHRALNVGDIQGTGLGLSIVKLCSQAHGGTVTVESKPNEGTTFTIQISAT